MKIAIIAHTKDGLNLGQNLLKEFTGSKLITTQMNPTGRDILQVEKVGEWVQSHFHKYDQLIFIGALGICVRSIAPVLSNKREDPAVINLDDQGKFVQSVIGGHKAGANDLTKKVGQITGANPVLSTSSDLQELWPLDTLGEQFNWATKNEQPLKHLQRLFVDRRKTALILEIRDEGSQYLEKSCPEFVEIHYSREELQTEDFELILHVGVRKLPTDKSCLWYVPKVLQLGSGCGANIDPQAFEESLISFLEQEGIAKESIATLGSIEVKAEERAYMALAEKWQIPFKVFSAEELLKVEVANPSKVVLKKVGVHGVAEASASLLSGSDHWLVEKTKFIAADEKKFTISLAIDRQAERSGEIAIVGAGSGDPFYLTVKGKELMEAADLVLYAGSLVPEEMLNWANPQAIVRNSASMTLEEQLQLMDSFYRQGKKIVRLHSGDPSIYGAIQEQMRHFEQKGYYFYIVPGISAFQAAAAYLKSEFTIPEVTQSIILTRGEGNTPMPKHENLEEMARHRATLCLFLSAGIAKKVQSQLMTHYPAETPLAVLYRVSWKDERVWTGQLDELSEIIRDNKLKRTVLIIVGEAIGKRSGRSMLYDPSWHHIFRKKEKSPTV
ncbi:precorrin-4 C(11)-methyltransferase [Xanthovirga aplysinae]|uniref:precorrin-4 C(11)-methyltransferase n=1 Tax=Xanthovirga aplysinae TaxID=2529853 RepID=UPI0012BC4149|nr:precorrin-4 C(11)-methyltransferase [Xanthovirga aplysinae]MTI33552.1 precorrin-4 C(11)-methyltransferase [Xanthovirga aplysinae]